MACLRLVADGKVTTEVRTFQTITSDLLRLSEWLAANECTHVAMEATGVYWKPVWHILDDREFALVISDKPLHGEIKLAGMADEFYRQRVGQHLEIGPKALEKLKAQEWERLHSRKLRSFAEVAFQ